MGGLSIQNTSMRNMTLTIGWPRSGSTTRTKPSRRRNRNGRRPGHHQAHLPLIPSQCQCQRPPQCNPLSHRRSPINLHAKEHPVQQPLTMGNTRPSPHSHLPSVQWKQPLPSTLKKRDRVGGGLQVPCFSPWGQECTGWRGENTPNAGTPSCAWIASGGWPACWEVTPTGSIRLHAVQARGIPWIRSWNQVGGGLRASPSEPF